MGNLNLRSKSELSESFTRNVLSSFVTVTINEHPQRKLIPWAEKKYPVMVMPSRMEMKPSVATPSQTSQEFCVLGEPPSRGCVHLGRDSIKMPFSCALPPAVQEDAEPGAHPPVRDEPLRQPSVRVHFQHFPG